MLRRETALPSAKEKKVVDVFILYALVIGHCLIQIVLKTPESPEIVPNLDHSKTQKCSSSRYLRKL